MNDLPTISVVIPAYNEEKYLPKCLTALTQQSYPKEKYTITVVDNNSTDQTATIARKFSAEVITAKEQGYIHSLNAGLKHAKNEVIAVTDADTIVSTTWLEDIAKVFQDKEVIGMTGFINIDVDSPIKKAILQKLYHLFQWFNFTCGRPHFVGPNMAVRNSAFKELKEIDTRYEISGDVILGMLLRKKVKYASRQIFMF